MVNAPDLEFERLRAASNLTRRQLRAWIGYQARPELPLWNLATPTTIYGKVDPNRWEESLRRVVHGSDALSSRFILKDGLPHREVMDKPEVTIDKLDFRGEADPHAAAKAWIKQVVETPIPFEGPILRSGLMQVADEEWVWFFNVLHILVDGVALEQISSLVFEGYISEHPNGSIPVPELARFEDYIERERAPLDDPRLITSREYWNQKLAAHAPPAEIDGRRKDPGHLEFRRLDLDISDQTQDRLQEAGAKGGIHNVLLAVFAAWLAKTLEQTELSIGIPIHNRRKRSEKKTIGLLMDVVPLRLHWQDEWDLATATAAVSKELRQLLRHDPAGLEGMPGPGDQAFLFNVHPQDFHREGGGLRSVQSWTPAACCLETVVLQITDFAYRGRPSFELDLDNLVFPGQTADTTGADFHAFLDHALAHPEEQLISSTAFAPKAAANAESCGAMEPHGELVHAARGLEGVLDATTRPNPESAEDGFILWLATDGDLSPMAVRRQLRETGCDMGGMEGLRIGSELPPACAGSAPAGAAPQVPGSEETTNALIETFEEILACPEVKPEDHFLDLGGNSLKAVLVTGILQERHGIHIRPEELFTRRLDALASLIDHPPAEAPPLG